MLEWKIPLSIPHDPSSHWTERETDSSLRQLYFQIFRFRWTNKLNCTYRCRIRHLTKIIEPHRVGCLSELETIAISYKRCLNYFLNSRQYSNFAFFFDHKDKVSIPSRCNCNFVCRSDFFCQSSLFRLADTKKMELIISAEGVKECL